MVWPGGTARSDAARAEVPAPSASREDLSIRGAVELVRRALPASSPDATVSALNWKSVPSRHWPNMIMASLRATASRALRKPILFGEPQAPILERVERP